jgi:hypothetical protein
MSSGGLPVAEGGRPGSKDGGSHWMVIGAVAGVGVLAVMLLKGAGGGATGTTAAGTSINAALGSIQEQNMNVLGAVGAADQHLTQQLSNVNDNMIAGQQLTVDQTRALYIGQNLMAARVLQQQAGMAGNQADAQSWTDYLNTMIPYFDTLFGNASTMPTAKPIS